MTELRADYSRYARVFTSNRLNLEPFTSRLRGETDIERIRDGVAAMRNYLICRGFLENDPVVTTVDDDNRPEFDLACRQEVEGWMESTPVRPDPPVRSLGVVNPVVGKFYMIGDVPLEVVRSVRSGNLYCRRRIRVPDSSGGWKLEWEYAKGAIFRLREAGREATVDDIAAFSMKHCRCFVCGRELKREASRAKGIGPVCEKTVQLGRGHGKS